MLTPWKERYDKAAAAAAKSLQSCPTLCDPMDYSPPGSSKGFSRQEYWSGVLLLESILKSRDITLLTKIHTVKAMVFQVVMYRCESWTTKKAEC